MFTGIVEEIGRLRSRRAARDSVVIEVEAGAVLEDTGVGDSIATAGVCLTVTRLGRDRFWADAMPETVRRTTLGRLEPGASVNLERALTLQKRMGGHLVTGHADGVGRVTRLRDEGNALVVTVAAPPEVLGLCVPQGSIAMDGVSLTVVDVLDDAVTVSLIPHTVSATTLRDVCVGSEFNLEADVIGKYVLAFVSKARPADGLTWEKLAETGFL
jgi:riboflavin synthase